MLCAVFVCARGCGWKERNSSFSCMLSGAYPQVRKLTLPYPFAWEISNRSTASLLCIPVLKWVTQIINAKFPLEILGMYTGALLFNLSCVEMVYNAFSPWWPSLLLNGYRIVHCFVPKEWSSKKHQDSGLGPENCEAIFGHARVVCNLLHPRNHCQERYTPWTRLNTYLGILVRIT